MHSAALRSLPFPAAATTSCWTLAAMAGQLMSRIISRASSFVPPLGFLLGVLFLVLLLKVPTASMRARSSVSDQRFFSGEMMGESLTTNLLGVCLEGVLIM